MYVVLIMSRASIGGGNKKHGAMRVDCRVVEIRYLTGTRYYSRCYYCKSYHLHVCQCYYYFTWARKQKRRKAVSPQKRSNHSIIQ